jgi:hypothetical protein
MKGVSKMVEVGIAKLPRKFEGAAIPEAFRKALGGARG